MSMNQPFFDAQPYASQRAPVYARNVVATSQPLAAQAGLQMLRQGGNAVDAAIATAIALTVVEPTSNGIGSDGFAIVSDPASPNQLIGLNASGRSPAAWDEAYFAKRYPQRSDMPDRGWDSVTVPGAVSQWVALSQRFGKLDFAQLFTPAIGYARDGFLVSPITAHSWGRQIQTLSAKPECASLVSAFTHNGNAPKTAELWRFPAQAHTLELIAKTNGVAFYRGVLAQQMVDDAKRHGGALTMADLAEHQADWVTPISVRYRDVALHEIPPNGQGLAALIALGILENFNLKQYAADSAETIHLQIEAMKLAFADAHRYIADSAAMDVTVEALLAPAYLKQRAALISMQEAKPVTFGLPKHGGTIYLATADNNGMMCSLIQSNYMGFGAGVVVPNTGISLQNRGAGFNRITGHPNCVAPKKRPFQTIIPGFLTDANGAPRMSFGVMGGPMQPQGHIQMVIRMIDYGQNPQTASDAPRWVVNPDYTIGLETAVNGGFPASVIEALEAKGHKIAPAEMQSFAYGGAQLIWRLDDGDLLRGYVAGSDHRKDGGAVGF